MAQGREWTAEEKSDIILSLKPYLEMGFSRNKACEAIGLAPQSLSNWVTTDESLRMKLKGWENAMNMLAVANIHQALQKEAETEDARKETSKWYVERRMKNEFSTRTEQTGAEGGPIQYEDLSQLDDSDLDRIIQESEGGKS